MKIFHILVLFAVLGISCSTAKNLPSFIQKCKRSDPMPEQSKCIVDRAIRLKPYLLKGIPELKIPPIEPLYIAKLAIETRKSSSFAFDCYLTDLEVYGVKDFEVKELRIDWEKKEIFLHFYVPSFRIPANYKAKGKLLLFELDASGKAYINITNIEAKSLTKINMATKNGKEYALLEEDLAPAISYEKIQLYFANIIPNNQELTQEINKAINDNFDQIAEEVNLLIYNTLRILVYGIIKPVFSEYALDELFD